MQSSAPRLIFVGYTVPDEDMDELLDSDPGMPIQTHRFAWSVVRGLAQAGAAVDLLSTLPASNYPLNSRFIVRGRRFRANGVNGRSGSYVNLVGLKHLMRFIWISWRLACDAARRGKPTVILVHGTVTPLLAASIIMGRLTRTPVVPVVTDPPAWRIRSDSRVGETIRMLDDRLTFGLLNAVDAVIALTEPLARDFVPGRPFLVMEGVAPSDVIRGHGHRARPSTAKFKVVYAGGIKEDYGVGDLIRAIESVEPNAELHLFGKGPMVVQERGGVIPHGMVRGSSLSDALADADILVNPRDPDQHFTAYSFPSKLLEYLLTGRPTVSTRLPGIPAEYEEYVNWVEGSGPEAIATAIERVRAHLPEAEARARAARLFVLEEKTPAPQGRRMLRFLMTLAEGERGRAREHSERPRVSDA